MNPNNLDFFLFGTLVGLASGYILAFIVDSLDRREKSRVREHTGTDK